MNEHTKDFVRPRVGVSACLLGQPVRYDGRNKNCKDLSLLADECELVPVCPEVGMGLPVPRPPIEVWRGPDGLGLRQVDNKQHELAPAMCRWFERQQSVWQTLDGYVLKSRSPSCGVGSTPVFSADGRQVDTADGLFVTLLRTWYPNVVLVDEQALNCQEQRAVFLYEVAKQHAKRGKDMVTGIARDGKKA